MPGLIKLMIKQTIKIPPHKSVYEKQVDEDYNDNLQRVIRLSKSCSERMEQSRMDIVSKD